MGKWEHDNPNSLYTQISMYIAKYHGILKTLQHAYENEMNVWKYNEDSLKAILKQGKSCIVCKNLECCKHQH